ncbi:unnamed protein product [Onchocerca flexuosa]|uniref:Uncharacterized protein n=1 Tax=Onchocerca flexuosa TaxID=387005 RepID=A0A183HI96_9BILA|nr:unnamed protein product [Onchocerca flexuosa]
MDAAIWGKSTNDSNATERPAAKLEDERLRAHRSCSAASDLLCSEQNECCKLRLAERRQQETRNQRQTGLRVQSPCILIQPS